MKEFLYILLNIQLPIMILIAIGFVFQKTMKIDSRTFSKLVIYVLVPVLILIKIYNMDLTWDFFLIVVPFILLMEIGMFLLSMLFSIIFKYERSKKKAFSNALILFNTGNYGIPLIDLVFKSNPVAMASQMLIIVIQNITANTFSVFQASSGNASRREALKNTMKMPALYVIALVALIKLLQIRIPEPVMIPLNYIADAFIGLALISLGIQLAEVKAGFRFKDVILASMIKVISAPLLAYALVLLLGVKGLLAQALVIGISTPTAVNTAIIAKEFDNEPDYTTGIVFLTTIFCMFTLPVVIYLANVA
ncbi:MAG: AEC family transporter [Bacillota bacterium]